MRRSGLKFQGLQGNRVIKEKSVFLRQTYGGRELLTIGRVPIGLEVEMDGMDEIPERNGCEQRQ